MHDRQEVGEFIQVTHDESQPVQIPLYPTSFLSEEHSPVHSPV